MATLRNDTVIRNSDGQATSAIVTAANIVNHAAGKVSSSDNRSVVTTPQTIDRGTVFDFKQNSTESLSDGGTYFGQMTFRPYGTSTDWSGTLSHQLGFTDSGNIWQRSGSSTTWGAWKKILNSSNYSGYALPLSGGTLTGGLSGTTAAFSGQITNTIATGTAPFAITSTTLVSNLNVQYLNGQLGSYYAAASSLASYLPLAGGTLTGSITATNHIGPGTGLTGTATSLNIGGSATQFGGYTQDLQTVVGTGDYLLIRNQAASKISLASAASVATIVQGAASGSWGISVTGNAATVGSVSKVQLFNNTGIGHGTYTTFAALPEFGFYFMQGQNVADAPPAQAANQYYVVSMGLGNEYSYSQYAKQIALPRITVGGGNNYLWIREKESSTWGSWGKVYAGYADTAGNASTVTTNANLTGHITSVGNATSLGSFTSAQLLAALTDETGTGANVFATSPTLVTPILGTPSSGNLANCTFPTLNQNTTGNAATATNVSWSGVTGGTRSNYALVIQPPSGDYAGFDFKTSAGGGGGYFLIRGIGDTDVYTADGITLVADAGWLTLAQRTTASRGVRIMTGTSSAERLKITTAGDVQIVNGNSFTYNSNVVLHAGNYTSYPDATKLPLAGGTLTGVLTLVSSGTAINISGQSDSFGYNATAGQGTYIKGTGTTYIYGGGAFFDGTAVRTLLHSASTSAPSLSIGGNSANVNISNLNTQQVSVSLAAGSWYTIAANDGNRASAKFTITDTSSGLHQAIHFYATAHYGTDSGAKISVISNTYYGGPPVSAIKIMRGSTYDGAMVQIYAMSACALTISIYDNQQSSGWVIKSGVVSTTNPGTVAVYAGLTTIAASVDLSAAKSFSVSDEIYIGGATTQYKALHANNYNSYALPLTGGTLTGALLVNNDNGVRASYDNGGSYAWLYGYGIEFGRATSYIRPNTNRVANLWVGNASINSQDWANIDFYSSGRFNVNNNAILHAGNYGGYSTFSGIVSSASGGFQTATYAAGRNRIWTFGNADGYGINYYQGAGGISGNDVIGLNFGNATAALAQFQFLASGSLNATGTITATNFSGPGSNLTGTASNLNIGGTAYNITQYTINQSVGSTNSPTFATLQLTRLNFGADNAQPWTVGAGGTAGTGLTFGGDYTSSQAYKIFTAMENVGGNYSKLTLNWHTGIRIGAYYGYGGTRFYNNLVGEGTEIFSVGNTDSNVRVVNSLIVNGITINQQQAANARMYGATTGAFGLLGLDSAGSFRWQVYGDGSSYGFLNGVWAGWDIKKTVSGALYLNDNNTYYLNPASLTNLYSLTVANTISGSITGNAGGSSVSCTGNAASSTVSTYVSSLGNSINYEPYNGSRTAITKTNGLSHYSGYSTGANRPTTYDYTLQVADGSKGWEISMDWISLAGPAIFARSLRDCCQGWSAWVRILDSVNYSYAAAMNQNVGTGNSPSFTGLSVINTITGAVSGNAGTVTNGLYTTGGQTIAGITYFSNGESINAYGIRGRFTNEYLHLYNKVGVGHSGGWGQGETSTPDKGLSTYGGLNIAYGDNGISTFNGVIRANSNIRQGADLARPLSSWSVTGTSTGMVIFSFPGNTSNYGMVHCVFDIYEYNSNTVSTVIVGGHNYGGSWYNTGANVIGRCGKSVRLGVKDSKYCVVFGGAASSWEYGTIILRKIHNGGFYTGIMDMGGSFTTQQTATESFSNISGDLRALRTSADFIADGGISGTTGTFSGELNIAGNYQIRNTIPTITFRDTDHRTGFIHVNSNIFYILTGVADSGYGNWTQVANSRWPLELNLSTNNAVFGADVNAISFTGAGTGLTGTATSLSVGGNAATATGQQSGVHFTLNTGGAGYGLVGVYNPDLHQGLFAMGPGYTLGAGGTLGNLYGVSWSYDYSGRQLNTGYNLGHCLAIANAGSVYTVIGQGIWTSGLIRANGAISSGGTITAAAFSGPLTGNVIGNVTGNLTGLASSATTAGNVNGYSTSTGVGANTIVVRDASGYIYAHYINTNVSESENPSVSSFFTSNGDGWLRKSTVAHVKYTLSLSGTNTGDQTNISGSSGSCTGNAASVTDGVYLSTNQSIGGVKTFSSAPIATNIAKAWVYYNKSTTTINASYNVSSVTSNGTGVFTVNFTNAMVDTNYVVAGTATYGYDDQDIYGMALIVPRRSTAQQAGSCRLATEFLHAAQVYDCVAVRAVFYR